MVNCPAFSSVSLGDSWFLGLGDCVVVLNIRRAYNFRFFRSWPLVLLSFVFLLVNIHRGVSGKLGYKYQSSLPLFSNGFTL